jgi:ubiquinone/menaquinone biosynthesis C-methylase UbiE
MAEPASSQVREISQQQAAKAATIEQWTADPCGSGHIGGELGEADYFRDLIAMRHEYAPWMEAELDYAGAAGERVLDVGSGQGIDLAGYARGGADAVGIDLTPRHVELANAHLAAVGLDGRAVLGDGEQLPFPDGSFDRVSSNGVLHHTPDIESALQEVTRVLKPGGAATLIVYNRDSLHYWVHQVLTRGVLLGGLIRERGMAGVLSSGVEFSSIGARPLVRVYGRRQFAGMLEEAGLERVSVSVRHFRASDTLPTRALARVIPALRDQGRLDRIGRRAGWYLIGRGHRPAGPV